MVKLGVNIDHVATLRQARRTVYPDPVHAAVLAELGGADGITVHLREDRRHIQDRDLGILKETVSTRLNLEMAATPAMTAIAAKLRPSMVTLVPEKREELTTEGGLDTIRNGARIAAVRKELSRKGIAVFVFIDPDRRQIAQCAKLRVDGIEIHTGRYADAAAENDRDRELAAVRSAAAHARKLGLVTSAGHGLNYVNVQAVAAIDGLFELNIGHSIVARAVLVGMERAVREMNDLIRRAGSSLP